MAYGPVRADWRTGLIIANVREKCKEGLPKRVGKKLGAGDPVKKYINEMIKEYTNRPLSPWHMPGHKRKPHFGGFWDEAFSRDLTEVPGTDDYHHPEGAIRDSQAAAAEVYGTAYSHYLVGGTTAGILAGILAMTEIFRGKTEIGCTNEQVERPIFLVAGNVHRSVHHALRLACADAVTLKPEGDLYYGPVMPDEVERTLNGLRENGDLSRVAGCVITSPTYGGAVSPLKEIHEILEKEGIPLFVDEAHGAHLPFIPGLSEYSGIAAGAELVVQSLHKTLPALTQTGIIHVGKSTDTEKLEQELSHQLSVVQSSSPSYILLASAEQAVAWADEGRDRFTEYYQKILEFREKLKSVFSSANAGFSLEDFPWKQDPTRIFLRCISEGEGDSGISVSMTRIAEYLEKKENIVVELAGVNELILISTISDQDEDFDQLLAAFRRITEKINSGEFKDMACQKNAESREERNDKASVPEPGERAKKDIYVYPPGILILREGDTVTEEAVLRIIEELAAGRTVRGL